MADSRRAGRLIALTVGVVCLMCSIVRGQEWRDEVPKPVLDKRPELVELYWRTWELAYDHVLTQPGLPQQTYMDEAFDPGVIWIWDTAFMAHFTKYAPHHFPGVESFKNFYVPLHKNTAQQNQSYPLRIQHPDNPPLFSWGEHANFKLLDNTAHISQLIKVDQSLQKHYEWFDSMTPGQTIPSQNGSSIPTGLQRISDDTGRIKGYKWSGTPSGMDNTPRGRGVGWGNMLWVDAISQQALSAKNIVQLATAVGDSQTASDYQAKYDEIKAVVNQLYWDDQDGFYYDIAADSTPGDVTFSKVKTPASYWPLLAGLASPEQAARMAQHARDPNTFGGPVPWTTVARDDPAFQDNGGYWRGGVWLPTAYMAIKSLENYGHHDIANKTAADLLWHMQKTYAQYDANPQTPEIDGTIWEYYDPDEPRPGQNQDARPDFTGWSALGPISLLVENYIGFNIDAQASQVTWRLSQPGRVGIEGLRFGGVRADIVALGDGTFSVNSTQPFQLRVNAEEFSVGAGQNTYRFVNTTRGDVDGNGLLDEGDIIAFKSGWRSSTIEMAAADAYQQGDLNYDGTTDLNDWLLLRRAFINGGQSALLAGAEVPEPAASGSIAIALGIIAHPSWRASRRAFTQPAAPTRMRTGQ